MNDGIRSSNINIVITGLTSEIGYRSREMIDNTFYELFGDSSRNVSSISEGGNIELIYEIQTPIFDEEDNAKEFYEDLEVLLEELKEFNPHFTQFRR